MAFRCRAGLSLLLAAAPLAAQPSAGRDSLRLLDQRVSRAVFQGGLVQALPAAMAADAVVLLEGAPIIRGRDGVRRLLEAQPALATVRLSWEPFRVLVSNDGTLGVSFGGTVVQRTEGPPGIGRYISVWRRGAGGSWALVAHLENGLLDAEAVVRPAGLGTSPPEPGTPDPFVEVDLAFSRLAGAEGAPAAFARYAAADGMTLAPTGELNLGPAAIRARLQEGRAATARWQWHPVISFAAPSGDLGVTIGEAEIRLQDPGTASPFYSKYLSVWQRQPDGSLKFVLDGGSARPAP